MRASLIACSQCNWQKLDSFAGEVLGTVISKRLQGTVLNPSEPASYPASLCCDDPLRALRGGHKYCNTFEHGFMTIISELDDEAILQLALLKFNVTPVAPQVVLVSASYSHWFNAIVTRLRGCTTELELFLTYSCIMLENLGFRQMFVDYPRTLKKVDNETYIIFTDGDFNECRTY